MYEIVTYIYAKLYNAVIAITGRIDLHDSWRPPMDNFDHFDFSVVLMKTIVDD